MTLMSITMHRDDDGNADDDATYQTSAICKYEHIEQPSRPFQISTNAYNITYGQRRDFIILVIHKYQRIFFFFYYNTHTHTNVCFLLFVSLFHFGNRCVVPFMVKKHMKREKFFLSLCIGL